MESFDRHLVAVNSQYKNKGEIYTQSLAASVDYDLWSQKQQSPLTQVNFKHKSRQFNQAGTTEEKDLAKVGQRSGSTHLIKVARDRDQSPFYE